MICGGRVVATCSLLIAFLLSTTRSSSAMDSAVEPGSQLSAGLWFVGAIVLGLVTAYVIELNNARSRAKTRLTEKGAPGDSVNKE